MRAVKQHIYFLRTIGPSLCLLICSACAMVAEDKRPLVSDLIQNRVEIGLPPISGEEAFQLPEIVTLNDGLSEEEAIAIALWNNAQFQVDLAQLGLAKADLLEAGMISNPAFSLLFPIGPKQMEWTLSLPIEFLWQRPHRVAVAEYDVDEIAYNMVQNGLSLIKSVLTSYADLILAKDRARILQEELKIHKEIVGITESRLKAGDISEIEAIAIRLAAAQAEEDHLRFASQAEMEEIRLKTLLGMIAEKREMNLSPNALKFKQPYTEEELLNIAYAARPDMRAAEIAIEAAGKALDWEGSKIWYLTATLDANEEGKEGFEMGPGIQTQLPLFHRNEGGRSRAAAKMARAVKQYKATRHQIVRGVREAYQNYIFTTEILNMFHEDIVPDASQASEKAKKTYLLGEISYLAFLDFEQQLLDARLREAEAVAAVRKAEAQLRYSIGFKPTAGE